MTDRLTTRSQRARASEEKLISAGGARLGMVLPPGTVLELEALVNASYATSRAGAIRRAIAEAHQRTACPNKEQAA